MNYKYLEYPIKNSLQLIDGTKAAKLIQPSIYKKKMAAEKSHFVRMSHEKAKECFSLHEILTSDGYIVVPFDVDGLKILEVQPESAFKVLTAAFKAILGRTVEVRFSGIRHKANNMYSFHGRLDNVISKKQDFLKYANSVNEYILTSDISKALRSVQIDTHLYKGVTSSIRVPWSVKTPYIEACHEYAHYDSSMFYPGRLIPPRNYKHGDEDRIKEAKKRILDIANSPVSPERSNLLIESLDEFHRAYDLDYSDAEVVLTTNNKSYKFVPVRNLMKPKSAYVYNTVKYSRDELLRLKFRFKDIGSKSKYIEEGLKRIRGLRRGLVTKSIDANESTDSMVSMSMTDKIKYAINRIYYELDHIHEPGFIETIDQRLQTPHIPTQNFETYIRKYNTIAKYIALLEGFTDEPDETFLCTYINEERSYFMIPESEHPVPDKVSSVSSAAIKIVKQLINTAFPKIPKTAIEFDSLYGSVYRTKINMDRIPCHTDCCLPERYHESHKMYVVIPLLGSDEVVVSRLCQSPQTGCKVRLPISRQLKAVLHANEIEKIEPRRVNGVSTDLDSVACELDRIPTKVVVLEGNPCAGKTTAVLHHAITRGKRILVIGDRICQCAGIEAKIKQINSSFDVLCYYTNKATPAEYIDCNMPYAVITTLHSVHKIPLYARNFDIILIDEWNSFQSSMLEQFGNPYNKYVSIQEIFEAMNTCEKVFITEPFINEDIVVPQMYDMFSGDYCIYRMRRQGIIPEIVFNQVCSHYDKTSADDETEYDIEFFDGVKRRYGLCSIIRAVAYHKKEKIHIIASDKIMAVNMHAYLVKKYPEFGVQLITGDTNEKSMDESNNIIISTLAIAHAVDILDPLFKTAILIKTSNMKINELMNGAMRIRHPYTLHIVDTTMPVYSDVSKAAYSLECERRKRDLTVSSVVSYQLSQSLDERVVTTLSHRLSKPNEILKKLTLLNAHANIAHKHYKRINSLDFVLSVFDQKTDDRFEAEPGNWQTVVEVLYNDCPFTTIDNKSDRLSSDILNYTTMSKAGVIDEHKVSKAFSNCLKYYTTKTGNSDTDSELTDKMTSLMSTVYSKVTGNPSTEKTKHKNADKLYTMGFVKPVQCICPVQYSETQSNFLNNQAAIKLMKIHMPDTWQQLQTNGRTTIKSDHPGYIGLTAAVMKAVSKKPSCLTGLKKLFASSEFIVKKESNNIVITNVPVFLTILDLTE